MDEEVLCNLQQFACFGAQDLIVNSVSWYNFTVLIF